MSQVPVIDLSAPSPEAIAALDAACHQHGFFLLSGHGADALIEQTWDQASKNRDV